MAVLGHRGENGPFFTMVRRTPSRWRSKAAYKELATPFRLRVEVVLVKRHARRKRVQKGLIDELAMEYGCNARTIQRIRTLFRVQISVPGALDLHCNHRGNCGRPLKTCEEVREQVLSISPARRRTIRSIALMTGMPKSTIRITAIPVAR